MSNKKDKKEPTYWEWLVHGKGTVSEPWPTAEELLNNKELQKKVKKIATSDRIQIKNNGSN